MAKRRRVHRLPTARGRRRSRSLAIWALVAAVAGAAAFLVVYATTSGGGGKERFAAQVAETPSGSAAGQPFQGGPRLYLPVKSVDLGQVPLKTVVSHAFDLRNVGDATLRIEDAQVKMLEGC
jgi:hypothetical protein